MFNLQVDSHCVWIWPCFYRPTEHSSQVGKISKRNHQKQQVEQQLRKTHRSSLEERAQATLHLAWPEVGDVYSSFRVEGQSLLSLVRRTHRLHFHHRQLDGPLAPLVAIKRPGGGVVAVHGQGQHPVPHGVLPLHLDRGRPELEVGRRPLHDGVPELGEDQIQQVQGHRRLRQRRNGHQHPEWSLALLLDPKQTWNRRHWILLERLQTQNQFRVIG